MSKITNELLGVCKKKRESTAFVFLRDKQIVQKSYFELLTETLKSGGGLGSKPITVSDLK